MLALKWHFKTDTITDDTNFSPTHQNMSYTTLSEQDLFNNEETGPMKKMAKKEAVTSREPVYQEV